MTEVPGRIGQLRSMWDLLQWLWEHTSAPERELRRKCMAIHSVVASAYAAVAGLDMETSSTGEYHLPNSANHLHYHKLICDSSIMMHGNHSPS
jgi:hypothetical protein